MAETILFRGCTLKHFDVRRQSDEGGVFCRIHMSADYSKPVLERMQWEALPDNITSAKLKGSLLATHFVLTPADKELRQHELQMNITSVEDFQVVATQEDQESPIIRELRFIVRTPEDGAEALLGQYIRRIGSHGGALKVSYTKQDALPLEDANTEAGDRQASFDGEKDETEEAAEQAEPAAAHSNDNPEEEAIAEPANEEGVFESAATFDAFLSEGKVKAYLATLHVGPGQWIGRAEASVGGKGGFSAPFTATRIFPRYEIAMAYEARQAELASRPNINASGKAGARGWQNITEWFAKQYLVACQDAEISEEDMSGAIASAIAAQSEESQQPIPNNPDAPEWRSAAEIEAGVPHHVQQIQ